MKPVSPGLGIPEVLLAKDQDEYETLVGAPVKFDDGSSGFVTRWRLSVEEKEAIFLGGEDLFLSVLTFGKPFQPVALDVGVPEWLRKERADKIEADKVEAVRIEEEEALASAGEFELGSRWQVDTGALTIGFFAGFVIAAILLAAVGVALSNG